MTLVRDGDGSAELSPLLAELVAAALGAARETGGAVDPTIGSVLVGLGYDRDIRLLRDRDEGPRAAGTRVVVRRHAGWRALTLEGRTLRMPPGTQLDLGATAKAVAADRCAALVHDRLGTGVLVALGGDVATAGPGPADGWQVTVQDLPDDVPQQVTLRAGAAVATSSTAKRTWTQHGVRRHHLVDPATGHQAEGPWRSVTVVAPTCLAANTATTAALVKGEDALALAAQHRPPRPAAVPRWRAGHPRGLAAGGGGMTEALWALGRGTGVVALLMFTLTLVLGILTRSGRAPASLGRFGVAELHRTAALTGVGLIAVHLVSLFFDPYAQLRLVDLVVPFAGTYRPLWLGLGTVAVDLLLVVTGVSLLRHRVGPRVFTAVHWLTYALWPVALLHGLGTGTDVGSLWMDAVAVLCCGAVAAALAWRLTPSYAERGRVRVARVVAR